MFFFVIVCRILVGQFVQGIDPVVKKLLSMDPGSRAVFMLIVKHKEDVLSSNVFVIKVLVSGRIQTQPSTCDESTTSSALHEL